MTKILKNVLIILKIFKWFTF